MQSLGFAYALQPVLKRLYQEDPEEYRSRLNRHMEYFNTQPYLASFILGAVAHVEEDRAAGLGKASDVSSMKSALMPPLGALGDSFFWGGLKPLVSVIAVTALLAGAWWASLLFLLLYNIGHLWLRAGALVWGYRSAGDVVALMAHYPFMRMARRFKATCLAVLGGMLGMAPQWRPEFKILFHVPGIVTAFSGLAITVILAAALRKGGSPVKLMLGLAVVSLALAFAGVGL